MYNIEDVGLWFLSKEGMSPKKLQKLLYYSYAWFLTLQNESSSEIEYRLFENNFEAWVHGPVDYTIYNQYRNYGYRTIPTKEDVTHEFDPEVLEVLEQVWEVYGGYSGNELESITHQESPWLKARGDCKPFDRCDTKISDKDIFECYSERLA